jgi:hypothetical protein
VQRICGQLRVAYGGGGESAGSPFRSEAVNQRPGATGGDAASASQSAGRREAISNLPSANPNEDDCAHSFGNSNEKQILQTILGKEVWDTKAAETGQNQSHNWRCDFMNLMHPCELLAKVDYPMVIEEDTAKTTEDILLEDYTGGSRQDGPNRGPSDANLDNLSHKDGPELEIDPQKDGSGKLMKDDRSDKNLPGEGTTRKWKRRVRSPPLVQELLKGDKRNLEEAGLPVGDDPSELGKKGRLDAEGFSNMAWAETGHQPR